MEHTAVSAIAPNAVDWKYMGAMPTLASYANLTQAILTNRGQILIFSRSQPFGVQP
ncbi:hypothetical protein [Nostoc sp.]|uniref:hypothetical protein n=1 Tax=Nostoc sp. TaxID=1180 RepID=UPI002FF5530C